MTEVQAENDRPTQEQKDAAEKQIKELSQQIDFYITEYSVEHLAQKTRDEEFVVPDYQREYTWEEKRKWRFIESVFLGLPIPFLFFWQDPASGKLEIVDGSQRLRTLAEFYYNELELGELDKLTLLEGFRFADLPESRQRKFKSRSIRGVVLNEKADRDACFDVFDRINTGSKVANKAEIRRGALVGPFIDLVKKLAQDKLFVELAHVTQKQLKEREREELVTRFFAYGDGLEEYGDQPSAFLFAYTQRMNHKFKDDASVAEQYTERFLRVMSFIQKTFPYGFRKSPAGKVSPRARFEGIAIGSYLALEKKPSLEPSLDVGTALVEDPKFGEIIRSDGANAISKLEGRMHFVRDRLLASAK